MTNRPVYPNRPPSGGGWGIIVPAFLVFLAGFWPFIVWHGCKYGGSGLSGCGSGSDWTWTGQTWAACGIWWGLVLTPFLVAGLARAGGKRTVRPPKGRLRVEATAPPTMPPAGPPPRPKRLPSSLPVSPQPPSCQHLNAVMVLNLTEDEILAWLCPQCDTRLPEDFGKQRRPCCGTPHGLWHLDNCPHYREWRDITAQWQS